MREWRKGGKMVRALKDGGYRRYYETAREEGYGPLACYRTLEEMATGSNLPHNVHRIFHCLYVPSADGGLWRPAQNMRIIVPLTVGITADAIILLDEIPMREWGRVHRVWRATFHG